MIGIRSRIRRFGERWPITGAWPYLVVLALGATLLLSRLGDYGLWDPWEPKYAQSAREMLERGSYAVPYFLDEVRLTKPILTYWGVLAGYALFGINELGARFAGACMAIVSMLGVLYAVWRTHGRRAGLLCACLLGTVPQFLFLARQSTPDVYLLTSLGMGLVFFALGLFGPRARRNLHFGISYLGLALAVLAKGPVIVGVIFGGTLAIYGLAYPGFQDLWSRESRGETLRFTFGVSGVAVAFGLFAPLAFLFGTSPEWWWYSDQGRADVAGLRDRILDSVSRFGADTILLAALACAGAVAAWRSSARRAPTNRWAIVRTIVLAAAALASLVALFAAAVPNRILAGALLGMGAAAWVGTRLVVRFVRQPTVWTRLQPALRPLTGQLLLFLAVFVAVAGPWHLAIFVEAQSGYFTDFIIKHNLHRAGETINRTGASDAYLGVLLYGYFPWSCLIPIGLASLVRWRDPRAFRSQGFEVFLLAAVLVTFVAFSASSTKFPHYLAPLLIPLAVLLGLTLDSMLDRRWPATTLARLAAAALCFPLVLDLTRRNGAEHFLSSFTVKQDVPSDVAPGTTFVVLLWAIFGCWLLTAVLRTRWMGVVLLAASALLAGYLTMIFVPALSVDKSVKALCAVWRDRGSPGEPIGLYGDLKFGVEFYTNHQVQRLGDFDEFMEFMRPERPAMCVVQRSRMVRARRAYRARYPGHDLHMVEPSHDTYATLANHALPQDGAQPDLR
jgi:4-amino-4-deoxy-L-arabinose transferase-like glycosyltransferase